MILVNGMTLENDDDIEIVNFTKAVCAVGFNFIPEAVSLSP